MNLRRLWRKTLIYFLAKYSSYKKDFRNWFQDYEVELYDLNKVAEPVFHYFNFVLVLLAVVSIIASQGFELPQYYIEILTYLDFGIIIGFGTSYLFRIILTSNRLKAITSRAIESALMFLLIIFGILVLTNNQDLIQSLEGLFGVQQFPQLLVLFTKIYLIIIVIVKIVRAAPILLSLKRKPTQVVAFSFLGVILFGAFLLMTPRATVDGLGL